MIDPPKIDPAALDLVSIHTTLPCPPLVAQTDFRTERLIIRRYQASDIEGVYELRTQPEVMFWTKTGKIDANLETTRTFVDTKLGAAAEDIYSCVICLADTGKVIGTGGTHSRRGMLGWPEMGYLFRKEYWGQGYGTEFVKGFLAAWWTFPRATYEIEVDRSTVPKGTRDGGVVAERLVSIAPERNAGSRRILAKCGMEMVKIWNRENFKDPPEIVNLYCHVALNPERGP